MVDDENDPSMIQAHREIMHRLGKILGDGHKRLTKSLLDSMFDAVKQHRDEWRTKGVSFPVLVALVVPRLGIVEFARADLDIASIRIKIINFVRFHPRASMDEVVMAFRGAYPDLRPGDVLESHSSGKAAEERQRDRQHRIALEAEAILKAESDKTESDKGST
jgi:hypothetical protein